MEETKLSPKEQQLLQSLYEMDVYNEGLKPVLERMGNGISRLASEQAQDWDTVMRYRGKLELLKEIHSFIKRTHEKGRKSSSVKSK